MLSLCILEIDGHETFKDETGMLTIYVVTRISLKLVINNKKGQSGLLSVLVLSNSCNGNSTHHGVDEIMQITIRHQYLWFNIHYDRMVIYPSQTVL